jgi:hypothetical protein
MSPAVRESCRRCGTSVASTEGLVLVRGKTIDVYCSDKCMRTEVAVRRRAARALRLRWLAAALLLASAFGAGAIWMHRNVRPPPASPPPAPIAKPVTPQEPGMFGPRWPPSDADWLEQFNAARWVYPLPGPTRRAPAPDPQTFAAGKVVPSCRTAGHCTVDLGGELWGEHVYAALDGEVERIQRDEAHGGISVRLSHLGGVVFTQYFHLAALPRHLARGAHVSAGDVIGLVGDTGLHGGRMHLGFALSVRPSSEYPEVFWDPAPLMQGWPLRIPPHGTVAGLTSRPIR